MAVRDVSVKLVIPGRLPGLNEYSGAERRNAKEAGRMKREAQERVIRAARGQLRGRRFEGRVRMEYLWVEQNRRRDKDNIAFAKKFVQDGLVQAGVLHNDGWARAFPTTLPWMGRIPGWRSQFGSADPFEPVQRHRWSGPCGGVGGVYHSGPVQFYPIFEAIAAVERQS